MTYDGANIKKCVKQKNETKKERIFKEKMSLRTEKASVKNGIKLGKNVLVTAVLLFFILCLGMFNIRQEEEEQKR